MLPHTHTPNDEKRFEEIRFKENGTVMINYLQKSIAERSMTYTPH